MVFVSSENIRCFGCEAEEHQVCSCPKKGGAQSAQLAMGVTVTGRASVVDSAVVAPAPMMALAEGVLPTMKSPSVLEAPVVVVRFK